MQNAYGSEVTAYVFSEASYPWRIRQSPWRYWLFNRWIKS